MQCLAAALPSLRWLEELTLRGNEMGPGAAALGPALSQLTNLRYIDLGDNQMGGEGQHACLCVHVSALLQLMQPRPSKPTHLLFPLHAV